MTKKILFFTIMLMFAGEVIAEKPKRHHNLKLTFNGGASFYFPDTEKPERLRQFNTTTDAYSGTAPQYLTVSRAFFSSTVDYYIVHNRLGLSTGVIVSRLHTNYKTNKGFFYWDFASNGTTTDFLRIRDFSQNTYYAGVPIEAKFFPRRSERIMNLYFKLGYSLNFRIGSDFAVTFNNSAMDKYREGVKKQLPVANSVFSNLYGCMGFKIGKLNAKFPQVNVEFRALDLVLSRNFAFFVPNPDSTAGIGFQLSVQFPLNKNVKIGIR